MLLLFTFIYLHHNSKNRDNMALKNQLTKSDYLPYDEFLRLLDCLRKDKKYQLELYARLAFCTACSSSDVLAFKWGDVLHKVRITVVEKKTKKSRSIPFNKATYDKISELYILMGSPDLESYIFSVRKSGNPISIQHLNRCLKDIKSAYKIKINNFSTHTFRKTFGRYVYEKKGRSAESLVLLNTIFRHSTIEVTKTYIGIRQDEVDNIFAGIEF